MFSLLHEKYAELELLFPSKRRQTSEAPILHYFSFFFNNCKDLLSYRRMPMFRFGFPIWPNEEITYVTQIK
jgi:hypothetical protein